MPAPLARDGDVLRILDQTRLPHEEVVLELHGAADTADAIRRLAVRGAPLIGVAAAHALALAVARDPNGLDAAWRTLRDARPTAANLAWAVDRVRLAALRRGEGVTALRRGRRRRGSGLGVILELADRREVHVLAAETRPLLQGARLTAWELDRAGVSHAVAVDGAVPGLIQRGEVGAVVTGLDRVAANGDVANKVGTYPVALAARAAGIPFVAAGPSSSIDRGTPTGADIVIEERDADEVRGPWALPATPVRNPAFDVTPAALVWALVTETGVTRLV